MNHHPPRLANWLLRSFCSYDYLETAQSDLQDLYDWNIEEGSRMRANLLYFREVFSVIFHLYFKGQSHYTTNSIAMFKNNIIIALRNFRREKSYSILNTIGLSSALVVLLLTSVYVFHELSYDRHHEGSENIYRVYKSVNTINDPDWRDAGTPGPLANALVDEFAEVAHAARFIRYRNILMETEAAKFVEPIVLPADPSVFKVFSFRPVVGEIDNFLNEPLTIAISRSTALKYFNRVDVVGETITFRGTMPMKVSGVFEDLPENSHFPMDVLVHFESVMEAFNQNVTRWGNNPYFTYVRLEDGTDKESLEFKLPQIREKYADDPLDEDGQDFTYFLQPLQDVHFNQEIQGGIGKPVDKQPLFAFLGVAIVIMIIASINYINMASARALVKMKEVGIRKVVGARRSNLIMQSLANAGVMVTFSMLVALVAAYLLLPALGAFVERPLSLDISNVAFWLPILGLVVLTTVLSGIYPAIIASAFKSIDAIYGRGGLSIKGSVVRKGLVIFQFSISTIFIIGALVLGKQLHYLDTKDIGYDKEGVVILRTIDDKIDDNLERYIEELRKVPGVSTVATSWSLPTNVTSNTQANWSGISDEERIPMYQLGVTEDFFELYGIELLEGRFFDEEIKSDRNAVILNETAVKQLAWDEPLGREMIAQGKGRVIGVVKDFHLKSLKEDIEPLQIILNSNYATLSVKINGEMDQVLTSLEAVYQSFDPDYPFQYRLLEDIYDQAYTTESNTSILTFWLTIMTIIIAALGLYGLSSHKIQQKTKELGVRKVMGASQLNLVRLLSSEMLSFLIWPMIIAIPVSYLLMQEWLNEFAYHINLNVGLFLAGGLIILCVSALTVGLKSMDAIRRNPVDSLRME